ncbi:alpha/beta hydrolase [Sphingomonas sinipercae]|uniref:alpha/beta hydrolase n=1 Tax=Sphingomonas sinipercae TaxID=2714944 RepID=UPI001FE923EA|nr:alpha/beta hydrolase [Sphingomonas sinipercae]
MRLVSRDRPELAAEALKGLHRYEQADRASQPRQRPIIAQAGPASLRDCGGSGRPVVLVPSLINPPEILDLDREVSLADALVGDGRAVLLFDWGPAAERRDLNVADHVEQLLVPLLADLAGKASVVGYCLGGTMAIAAAQLVPVSSVATVAAPWYFSAYPESARKQLASLWSSAEATAAQLGALPMEVLQGAFWSLDPERTVAKFARLAALEPGSDEERRFLTLEDWANQGEPLPASAAQELIQGFFAADLPGSGLWQVAGKAMTDRLPCPALHVSAGRDLIVPAGSAPAGQRRELAAGHVGMVVGSARGQLHALLNDFLAACGEHR